MDDHEKSQGQLIAELDELRGQVRRLTEARVGGEAKDEYRFRAIYDSAPLLIDGFDENGRCILWNKECEDVFGWTMDELNSYDDPIALFYPDPQVRAEVLKSVTSSPDRKFQEWHPLTKDGEERVCLWANVLLPDGTVMNLGHDITERKKAEDDLLQNERLLSQSQESANIGSWVWDLKSGTSAWSEQLFKIYGRDANLGVPPLDSHFETHHPDDREVVQSSIDAAIKKGASYAVDFRLFRENDGEERWIRSQGRIEHDHNGEPKRLLGVAQDITERKRAEEELLRSEYIVGSSTDMMALVDKNFTYLTANPTYLSATGTTKEDLIGQTVSAVVGEEFFQSTIRLPAERCLTGDKVNYQAWFQFPGHEPQYMDITYSPYIRDDQVEGYVVNGRDITERKRLEDQLRQSEKMQAVGELAGGIAHDFNNQLTGIMGYADMLALALEDEKLASYAEAIVRGAKRSADLTQQLLAFGRKGKSLSIPVNLHKVISEVAELLEHSIDKRITIQQILKANPCTAIGDPTQLQNALLNIAINARDAMPVGGEISFETSVVELDEEYCAKQPYDTATGRYVQVCVTDSGVGMTEETQKRIFEPFFTTKELGQGTGMGLAAVYGTVKNHNGTINVYSEMGHGTTFKVYLPLAESTTDEVESTGQPAAAKRMARILLVDDEPMVRDITATMLRNLGYKVTICKDGLEAVEYYRVAWKQVDLVVLDMIMPKMGGRETFLAMRAINSEMKALLSSGYAINGEAQSIMDEGVVGFLQKPFQMTVLSEKVAEVLDSL